MSRWLARRWYDLCYLPYLFLATLFVSFRATGRRNLPHQGPVLLMANHQSTLDPPFIGLASPRRLTYLARKSLFKNRIFRWLIELYGAIPIDQEGIGLDGIRAVLQALGRGEVVLLFPEGHRTFDGKLQPLMPGIALLIRKAKVPVVPVGIAGAYQAWPRGKKWPRLNPLILADNGAGLAVAIGKPITPEHFDGLDRDHIIERLSAEMKQVVAQAEAIRRKW